MELHQLIFCSLARDKRRGERNCKCGFQSSIIEMPANALVLLAEGAEEMETVITVDVLRHKLIL